MNVYRAIGLVCLIILFTIFLLGSILYGTPYPIVWFFVLVPVGYLVTRIMFRKELRLIKKGKKEEISTWNNFKNMYIKLMLFILIGYPLLAVPRYLAGTPLKTLSVGFIAFFAAYVTYGVLITIFIQRGYIKLEHMFTFPAHDLTFILVVVFVILASLGVLAMIYLLMFKFL